MEAVAFSQVQGPSVMSHSGDFLVWQLHPERKSDFPNVSQEPLGQITLSQREVGTLLQKAKCETLSLKGVQYAFENDAVGFRMHSLAKGSL